MLVDSIKLGGIVTVRDGLIAQQAKGRKVFRLESGDPSFSPPDHVLDAISKALKDGYTHYTAGAGVLPLREAIANKLSSENGIGASPDEVLITNGAMNGLYITFRSICAPGREVVMPAPTWTETADNVTLAGGEPVRAPLVNYRYTAEAIAPYITPLTCAIVINSPHNPTGMVTTQEELADIIRLAEKHDLWIVSDEAYEHVIYDDRKHISTASLTDYQKVVSIFSFSKSYAMSGLRLGYLTTKDKDVLVRLKKFLRCTINGVNAATQFGGVAALTGPQEFMKDMISEYQYRRDILYKSLVNSSLLEPVEPHGAFYLWCRVKNWEGDDWALTRHLIDEYGVGSAPGAVFGATDNHLRFSFSCSTDQIVDASLILKDL